jgi:hypothetical protein
MCGEIGMGVSNHPETFTKLAGRHNILAGAFRITAANRDYFPSFLHQFLPC